MKSLDNLTEKDKLKVFLETEAYTEIINNFGIDLLIDFVDRELIIPLKSEIMASKLETNMSRPISIEELVLILNRYKIKISEETITTEEFIRQENLRRNLFKNLK